MNKLMRAMTAGLLAVAVVCATESAQARDIFFDTFSGNQLRPHWQQPPPSHWEHTVADSRITVSGLFHPGVPGQPNVASMSFSIDPVKRDVVVLTADLGWEAGDGRSLSVRLYGPRGYVGAMGYEEVGGVRQVYLDGPFGRAIHSAPPPGSHNFRMMRGPDYTVLYVSGTFVGILSGTGFEILGRVEFAFTVEDAVHFAPLYVEHVRIVPTPGAVTASVCWMAVLVFGRRRRSQSHGRGNPPYPANA